MSARRDRRASDLALRLGPHRPAGRDDGWGLMVGAHGGWTSAEQVGSIGVFLLLLAFALHVWGRLGRNSLPYIGMNVIGAGLACWASWEIRFLPFVVLEGAWFLVATVELGRELFGRVSTA